MLFSSMTFIYVFLPIVLALYYILPKRFRNGFLLFSSIIFYAWGEPIYVLIMLGTIFINYIGAIFVSRLKNDWAKRTAVGITIIADLSILFYFKYFNFFVENIDKYLHGNLDFIHVVMPIGISFYTFQAISYVIDVYRKETDAQLDLFKVALYITFFPQLIAGPIVKYHDICEQIDKRDENIKDFMLGLKRFIVGFGKKVIIANTMALTADKIFGMGVSEISFVTAWIGAASYALQIYFDFSGYSDMAIGLGRMFGFKILENFNFPYISKSITEFWRRWHISLSTWFKQYLYIPLGGNRKGKSRQYINLFIVFFATGFWHGASWIFIIWGLWHGMFIIIEKATGLNKDSSNKYVNALRLAATLLIVLIGWVLFRAETVSYAAHYIAQMFNITTITANLGAIAAFCDTYYWLIFVLAIIGSTGLFKNVIEFGEQNLWKKSILNLYLFGVFYWSTLCLAASTYNPFIYFRF